MKTCGTPHSSWCLPQPYGQFMMSCGTRQMWSDFKWRDETTRVCSGGYRRLLYQQWLLSWSFSLWNTSQHYYSSSAHGRSGRTRTCTGTQPAHMHCLETFAARWWLVLRLFNICACRVCFSASWILEFEVVGVVLWHCAGWSVCVWQSLLFVWTWFGVATKGLSGVWTQPRVLTDWMDRVGWNSRDRLAQRVSNSNSSLLRLSPRILSPCTSFLKIQTTMRIPAHNTMSMEWHCLHLIDLQWKHWKMPHMPATSHEMP